MSQSPSIRQTLTTSLELAKQAVLLDCSNGNPEEIVAAYTRSMALLSEVIERISSKPYEGRNAAAELEEELRRLQTIVSACNLQQGAAMFNESLCSPARYVCRSREHPRYHLWPICCIYNTTLYYDHLF